MKRKIGMIVAALVVALCLVAFRPPPVSPWIDDAPVKPPPVSPWGG